MLVITASRLPLMAQSRIDVLEKNIVAAAMSVPELKLRREQDIFCLFPRDIRDPDLGDDVIIEISDLSKGPERAYNTHRRLILAIGKAMYDFFPDSGKVLCFVRTLNSSVTDFWVAKRASLEKTAADYEAAGNPVPPELQKHPDKTMAETMRKRELLAFVRKEVQTVKDLHAKVSAGKHARRELLIMVRDEFLLPNIRYLKRIRRLPAEFKGRDFAKEFAT